MFKDFYEASDKPFPKMNPNLEIPTSFFKLKPSKR